MAYRDFKLADLRAKFGITNTKSSLFPTVTDIVPSSLLLQQLERNRRNMTIRTEKAVSEAIIFPTLLEIQALNQDKISLFSGENLLADKSKGLNGEVDFLFTKQPNAFELTAPVISVTEAKLDRALVKAVNQCAAQMIGAQS